jgi:ABC-2 type transport system permease protein
MRNLWDTQQYVGLLIRAALRMAVADRTWFVTMSLFMFLQNMLMFSIWAIYFSRFSSLGGWHLEDLANLYGIAAFAFGMAFFLCGGALDVGRSIVGGELDIYLGRPRHPLPGLIFRESRVAGFGDIMTAPIIWSLFGHHGPGDLLVLTFLGLCSAMVILATALAFNCLPFFASESSRLSDQLLESFTIISSQPQNGFPLIVKVILMTLVPAGFVAYLPVEAFRTTNLGEMALLAGAALLYMALAVAFFNMGLRRYASGNRMLEVR